MSLDEFEIEEFIEKSLPRLSKIDSFDNFINFCKDFQEQTGYKRPIEVLTNSNNISYEMLEELKSLNYPKDFVNWHSKFGNIYLWLETTKIIRLESIIKEINSGYWSLLIKNGYQILTKDTSGNAYLLDTNMDVPEIKFVDHTEYLKIEHIQNIYKEHYNFILTKEDKNEGLDLKKVLDDNGEFLLSSPYIKKYYSKILKPTGHTTFLSFLKDMLDKGIRNYCGF